MTTLKNAILKTMVLSLSLLILQGCSDKEGGSERDFIYITDVRLVSHQATEITVDNFTRTIEFLLKAGENVSSVEIELTLASGVTMIHPSTATAVYDLSTETTIRLEKNGRRADFRIIARFESAPIDIPDAWKQDHSFGQLPDYLSVYQYRKDVSGKSTKAFIAVAAINPTRGEFRVLGEKTGSKTPDQFYTDNSRPAVVMNGGFFWSGTSLGLMIRDGVTLSHAQPVVNRDYHGTSTPYYPTQGAFGLENDGTFSARWVYESSSTLYAYPNPSPNKAGEQPQPVPTATFPTGAVRWQPVEAVGAGPLLLKNLI